MTRIEPLTNPTGKAAELLAMVQKKMGRVPNMMATLAHAPTALEMYLTMSQTLSGASLPTKVREQMALLAAKENSCDYCAKAHTVIGKMAGLSDQDVTLSADAKASDPKTQKLLELSQRIIKNRGLLSDAEVTATKAAGISDAEMLETVAVTCLNIYTNYINHLAEPKIDF